MSRDEILMEIEDYCDSRQCIDCVFYTVDSKCPFHVVTGYIPTEFDDVVNEDD